MIKNWSVEMAKNAENELRADFKWGKITAEDVKVIKRWIADVEEQGLEYAQQESDWRDHELEGEWKDHRARLCELFALLRTIIIRSKGV